MSIKNVFFAQDLLPVPVHLLVQGDVGSKLQLDQRLDGLRYVLLGELFGDEALEEGLNPLVHVVWSELGGLGVEGGELKTGQRVS